MSYPVSSTVYKPWTTQRVSNRYPTWARIRERDDSAGQLLINPVALWLDEILEELLKTKLNYYIPSVDLLEQPFAYLLHLPRTFEFSSTEKVDGQLTFLQPTIVATVADTTIDVIISDEQTLQSIDKSTVFPTRVSAERLITKFDNNLLEETPLVDLANGTINDDDINELGYLYISVDNATQFGDRLTSGTFITPKVIVTGTPWNEDEDIEEHLVFSTNAETPTFNRWKSITSIETQGIYQSDATLAAHLGFDKRYVVEPIAFWTDPSRETVLLYTYENRTLDDSSIVPTIQFNVLEVASATLQGQGFSDLSLEYEFSLMRSIDTFIPKSLVGLERIPFTRQFVTSTEDALYFFSARMPHSFNWIHKDSNGFNIVEESVKDRTPGTELEIVADRNWTNPTEDGWDLSFYTYHRKPIRGIKSTRLSVLYDSPEMSAPIRKYYDWDGNEIDITTSPTKGFISNSHSLSAPTDWDEKKLTLDIEDIVKSVAWVAVLTLETTYTDNQTETDTFIVHSDYRLADKEIAFPSSIKGKVNGIMFDAKGRFLVRTTDDEVWTVQLHYDHCLIDYRKNIVFFKEEYDSVQVDS